MRGYLNNPKATAETITPDGWLRSGDISYYDDSEHFYIVDRLKELIKVKAFQVPPAELEDLLRSHPDVFDVAVIGIPDERSGEVPLAFVVKKPESQDVNEASIHSFVNAQVAEYKRLAGGIQFVDAIPKTPSGKILRKDLRAEYEKKM